MRTLKPVDVVIGGGWTGLLMAKELATRTALEFLRLARVLSRLHGGNIGMVGWKMIGYPGPSMSWRDEIDKHFGEAFRPAPKSLAPIVGHPVKGMEDEPV